MIAHFINEIGRQWAEVRCKFKPGYKTEFYPAYMTFAMVTNPYRTYYPEIKPINTYFNKKKHSAIGTTSGLIIKPLQYADSLQVPRNISVPFLKLVALWKESTGVEHTVSRLKDIKLDFVRVQGGMKMCSKWIARSKTTFRGPLKGLHTWAKLSDKNFSKSIQLLQVYTLEISPVITLKQEEKFLKGVLAPNPPVPLRIRLGVLQASNALNSGKLDDPKSILHGFSPSTSKREPTVQGKSVPEGTNTLTIAFDWLYQMESVYNNGLDGLFNFHLGYRSQEVTCIPLQNVPLDSKKQSKAKPMKPIILEPGSKKKANKAPSNQACKKVTSVITDRDRPDHDFRIGPLLGLSRKVLEGFCPAYAHFDLSMLVHDFHPVHPSNFSIGKIGLIQEPGFKLRAVANPSRLVQHALQPMKEFLNGCLKKLPWDCTHDQSKAFPFIQEALQRGQHVYSVDLTDASSFFPLDLQVDILNRLLPDDRDSIDAFIYASRAPWKFVGSSGIPAYISWTRGQPLGLGPSFASAFLTHGLLLLYLNGYQHLNKFFVLGDDVIILDSGLFDAYTKAMAELKCPLSVNKCLSSNVLGEFAGKIITKNMVIPQHKWRMPSDNSFLDFVRNVGLKSIKLLPNRQKKVVEKLLEVPAMYGGIGFNPKGRKLSERVFLALLLIEESCSSYSMSYNRNVNRMLNPSDNIPTIPFCFCGIDDLEQRSMTYVKQYLPKLLYFFDILGRNLCLLQPTLDLPIEGGERYRTLLQILEDKLL